MFTFFEKFIVIVFKIFWAGVITVIGGYVTCGGNLQIPDILGINSGQYGPEYLMFFWASEILIILIWSLYFLFTPRNNQIRNVLITLSGALLLSGILSAFFMYGN